MTGGATHRLARWVSSLDASSLSCEVGHKVRSCMLDVFACAAAGAVSDPMRRLVTALTDGDTSGPGKIWFGSRTCSVWTEAFVHGAYIHALDYDDSHRGSKTHPGASVVPAVLAATRTEDVDLSDAVAGLVAGYEVVMRLGSAVGVAEHRRQGWHATSTCGTVGAAAAVARALRLDPAHTASALGNATTQAAGLWAFSTDGTMNKKFHPGHAARAGLGAALLARAGVTGSSVGLEAADGGFFAAFAPVRPAAVWEAVIDAVGEPFLLPEVAVKPYPCCRTAHSAIDAARRVREAAGCNIEDIAEVAVSTYRIGVDQCGFHDPVNETQAAFSTPYVVACALRDGWVGPEHFTEASVQDPGLRELHRRVAVEVDEVLDSRFPTVWAARVTVRLRSGQTFNAEVDVALGDPLVPMSTEQINAKASTCLGSVGPKSASELGASILDLPSRGPAAMLTEVLDCWRV